MKIAIQGHPTRGKEIIQILESLGGENIASFIGVTDFWYYIDSDGHIRNDYQIVLINAGFKIYTLEEFEKEFPFKVGDKVIHKEFNDFFEVISFNPGSSYPYKIKGVCEFSTKSYVLTKWQPKMKEERFVTLSFKKAKEWYKKGGELKEIALQAYSKEELTKVELPKTWEEFCKNYPTKNGECYIDSCCDIAMTGECIEGRDIEMDKNVCPSRKSAKAHLAMIQLEQLRNCWWNGWEPEWSNYKKYIIKWDKNDLIVFTAKNIHAFLVFPTREMAEEFLKCFKDLIEIAGDLI